MSHATFQCYTVCSSLCDLRYLCRQLMGRHILQWTSWLIVQRPTAKATIYQCHTVRGIWVHMIAWLNVCVPDESHVSDITAICALHVMQFDQPLKPLRPTDHSYCELLLLSASESAGVTKTSELIFAHALHIVFTTTLP